MNNNMTRNTIMTTIRNSQRHLHRSVGFGIRQQRILGFAIRYILLLMMTVGATGAWGATVTYHIINLGRLDNSGQLTSTRTEALRFTVTGESVTVGLPPKYKSPLAKTWKYYDSDDVTYDATTKECTFKSEATPTDGGEVLTEDADVYVTYELDEDAFSSVGLADGGIYNIKLADNKYLYQNTWQGDPNTATETTSNPTAEKYLWKLNITDPYQITIQSKSSDYTDYFLTAKGGAYADIRLRNTLSIAKENKVWAFALIPGGDANTYRLIIADGYTYAGVECDEFNHGYLNNNDSGKSRYQKYYQNNTYKKCDLTFQALTKTFTYKIVDKQERIAIQSSPHAQPVGKLSGYENIPEEVRSPYLVDETMSFYTFSGDYSPDKLSDENLITELPLTDATIYVTYTTDHLSEKALKLRGARAFNITANGDYIHDGESGDANSPNYMWYFTGGDPYAVQVKNVETGNYLESTLSTDSDPYNFILMSGSSSGDEQQITLMPALDGTANTSIEVTASPVSVSSNYYLIDKAGKLIVGPLPSNSQELALPTEWVSPLVSEYHYFKTSGYDDGTDSYSPTNEIYNPVEVGTDGGSIYVTYDVGTDIDITGGKTYLLKFLHGQTFQQEDGSDGLMKDKITNEPIIQKAVYPYNNGDFLLYVYGQEQWEKQLANGASTRTRWLWHIISKRGNTVLNDDNNSTPTKDDDIDPYHVIIMSEQNQKIKISSIEEYDGRSYLLTYKPNNDVGVVTSVAYENSGYYSNEKEPKMTSSIVNGEPTEYMLLGTSLDNMTLKTFGVIGDDRQIVDKFEQYWKNNPTVQDLVGTNPAANNPKLTGMGWHQYKAWAFAAAWNDNPKTKSIKEENHWFQTIDMGDGKFTIEEVSLVPQVILLDQHGWEIMRTPMYTDKDFTVVNTEGLSKFNSPMVKADGYHWYPKASKATGYHKYTISDPEPTIDVYMNGANPNNDDIVEWYCYKSVPYTSSSLAETPESNLDGYADQDKKYKTDFYVTYEVKPAYAKSYKGAATADATSASAFILEQDDKYAKIDSPTSTSMTLETSKPANTEDTPDDMLWNLKPNFNIDREMGYKYAGEAGAQSDAESKDATEAKYMQNGQNGFDPYNVQIQSKAYPQRYFTANTSGSALDGGVWKGSSSSVTLQNMTTTSRQTAAGYDQTTLNITNATFMVVDDGSGNMRLMPRFDHQKVMTSFTSLAKPSASVDATQTFDVETISKAKLIYSSDEIDKDDMNASYILAPGFTFTSSFTSLGTSTDPFKGTIDGQLNAISGLGVPLVAYANGATIKNVILEDVTISSGNSNGDVGAICCQAAGATRIYNCGILGTVTETKDDEGKVTSVSGSSEVSGTGNVGSIVGTLVKSPDNSTIGAPRVINCYSYAVITGGTTVGGLVGNIGYSQNTSITQTTVSTMPMVVNCMFYGDITVKKTSSNSIAPVYGGASGAMIKNNATNGVNPYCYFRGNATFNNTTVFPNIESYRRSWPAEEEYLTRFEYYRSILNSNRQLCTYWVTDKKVTDSDPTKAQTAADTALIAKWVLDPSIAPYPVLKKWGKYPSIINPDPVRTWDPEANEGAGDWQDRSTAAPYRGKSFPDKLSVTVKTGYHPKAKGKTIINDKSWPLTITDMDTLNYDYGYYKVQLPYYNEVFGNPEKTEHLDRFYCNYTDSVVTGWKITGIKDDRAEGGKERSLFEANWESGYNFADRNCINKDLYSKPTGSTAEVGGRVFAQGGYFYVPEDVSEITIEAYWGEAVYLANSELYIDRVNITAQRGSRQVGSAFTPAGTISSTFQSQTVQTAWYTAVTKLGKATKTGNDLNKTVYDQAIVLLSNFQLKNGNGGVGDTNNWYPYTMMSIDQDLDNEPDYCFELQFRNDWSRPAIQPIRFDFLPVVELGTAVRHNEQPNTIGIFIPQGHFEITETALMRTTQFEYDGGNTRVNSPVILNGGNFEQIVVRKGPQNKTTYFLLGGHFRIKRFTPGAHTNRNDNAKVRLCAVNVIGGEFPEFYLSGIYRPDLKPESVAKQGNPHCYTNGGYFGTMAGSGYDKILGSVTFKIDHSIIDEFYGGGINGSNPIDGNIDVTIDHSLVGKYCGGPKVGVMTSSVTTHATSTIFGQYYGGGNGGTSYYREQGYDGNDKAIPEPTEAGWTNFCHNGTCAKYEAFNPLNILTDVNTAYDDGTDKKGYHALYEFECFNESNGLGANPTLRTYTHWAQFGKTSTGNTESILNGCTFENDYYGGGNLANISGWVKSTLTDCTVKGNVFGGGYSGKIEPFRIHDKSSTVFPEIDNAGDMHNGSLEYLKDGTGEDAEDRYYTWCYQDSDGKIYPDGVTFPTTAPTTDDPTFYIEDPTTHKKKWYVLTTVSLKNLGTVSQYTELTLDGNTTVGTLETKTIDGEENEVLKEGTGNVFGGGNESAVDGNTTVNLQGNTHVLGNVFGGGNEAVVGGSATVNIRPETPQTQNGNSGQGQGQGGN